MAAFHQAFYCTFLGLCHQKTVHCLRNKEFTYKLGSGGNSVDVSSPQTLEDEFGCFVTKSLAYKTVFDACVNAAMLSIALRC